MRYWLTSDANEELVESALFYLNESPQAASDFEEEVADSLRALSANPERYGIYKRSIRVKHLDKFPFSIYYRIEGDAVHVLAIAHNSRRPEFWGGRA